jgi:hypothetical protein
MSLAIGIEKAFACVIKPVHKSATQRSGGDKTIQEVTFQAAPAGIDGDNSQPTIACKEELTTALPIICKSMHDARCQISNLTDRYFA